MIYGNEYADNWKNICSEYESISRDWYKDIKDYKKATLIRKDDNSSLSDGYDNDKNEILVSAPEKEHKDGVVEAVYASLENIAGLDNRVEGSELSSNWPKWKAVIVHEAIHEYEKKIIKDKISALGVSLHKKYKNQFPYPEKHDERFFTAVVDRSEYFGMTPECLVEKIR